MGLDSLLVGAGRIRLRRKPLKCIAITSIFAIPCSTFCGSSYHLPKSPHKHINLALMRYGLGLWIPPPTLANHGRWSLICGGQCPPYILHVPSPLNRLCRNSSSRPSPPTDASRDPDNVPAKAGNQTPNDVIELSLDSGSRPAKRRSSGMTGSANCDTVS